MWTGEQFRVWWVRVLKVLLGVLFLFFLLAWFAMNPRPVDKDPLPAAIVNVDVMGVIKVINSPAKPYLSVVGRHPVLYFLSEMQEDSSEEAARIMQLLHDRRWLGNLNYHERPEDHPLTRLYRQMRYAAIDFLLVEPGSAKRTLILEVYASHLGCEDIPMVHMDVALVLFAGETRDCMLSGPHTRRSFGESNVSKIVDRRYVNESATPVLAPVVMGKRRARVRSFTVSPRRSPPVGVLPDVSDDFINPAYFEDMVQAVYYCMIGSLYSYMDSRFLLFLAWMCFVCCLLAVLAAVWSDGVRPYLRARGRVTENGS